MNKFHFRTLSQEDLNSNRSLAETPIISHPTLKVPTYKDLIAPFVKQKSQIFKHNKKPKIPNTSNETLERAKVQRFLNSRKQLEKPQYISSKRDISHLNDKARLGSSQLKERSFNILELSPQSKPRPNVPELAEVGKNDCVLFPKVFLLESQNRVLDKDWICSKDIKIVSSRQEAGNLKTWFDDMRKKIILPGSLTEIKGLVLVTIKELYSQISVQCHDHGEIFMDLLEIYSDLINKFTNLKIKSEKSKISKNFEAVQQKLKQKIADLRSKVAKIETEKNELVEKEGCLETRIKTLEEDLNFQKELFKSPIRRRTSIGTNKGVYSLSKFAENLKKKFGEIGGLYDNIAELKPAEPYHIRISSYGSMQPEILESEISIVAVSPVIDPTD